MRLDPLSDRLLAKAAPHGPVALMYHSVTPGWQAPAWVWGVSMGAFEAQLDLLAAHGWRTVTVAELAAGGAGAGRTVAVTFDDGYADNYPAFEALARRGMRATWFIVSGAIGGSPQWKDPGAPRPPMLDAGQLAEMAAAGMEIGAHSRSHPRLTSLDDAGLAAEVGGSRSDLEALLARPVESFAYPYGNHDERVVAAVRAAGYRAACTVRSGWALRGGDPLRIRRVAVFAGDSPSTFARKLCFADNDVSWGRLAAYAGRRVAERLGR